MSSGMKFNGLVYNMQNNPKLWRQQEKGMVVYHFAGSYKPWGGLCNPLFENLCRRWREEEISFMH